MVDTIAAARPRRRLAPESRRRQIVDEATRLISQSGFNAVSLGDIAEACDIRKPSVLHYFPTMVDLLTAVLAERDREQSYTEALLASARGPADVRACLCGVVERNLGKRQLVRLFVVLGAEAIDPQHPAHAYFTERTRLVLHSLEKALDWKPDAAIAAQQLFAFWQGLETLWVADSSVDFLRVWDSFCDDFFA